MNSKLLSGLAIVASALSIGVSLYLLDKVVKTNKVINDYVDEMTDRQDRFDQGIDDIEVDDLDDEEEVPLSDYTPVGGVDMLDLDD